MAPTRSSSPSLSTTSTVDQVARDQVADLRAAFDDLQQEVRAGFEGVKTAVANREAQDRTHSKAIARLSRKQVAGVGSVAAIVAVLAQALAPNLADVVHAARAPASSCPPAASIVVTR